MNNLSFFWLLPQRRFCSSGRSSSPAARLGRLTIYAPLTVQMGMGMDMGIFALHILGASSIMGSINIITTILNMRAPGMTLMKMPMFAWTWLITAYLLIAGDAGACGCEPMTSRTAIRHVVLQRSRRR